MSREQGPSAHINFFAMLLENLSGSNPNKLEIASSHMQLERLNLGFLYDSDVTLGEKALFMQEKHSSDPDTFKKRTLRINLYASRFRKTTYLSPKNLEAELQDYRYDLLEQKMPQSMEGNEERRADLQDLLSHVEGWKKARAEGGGLIDPGDIIEVISGLSLLTDFADQTGADHTLMRVFEKQFA